MFRAGRGVVGAMSEKFANDLKYLIIVPAAIAMLWATTTAGIYIPNQPGVLLLAVVFCAYRGGLGIGLGAAAIHMIYAAEFFSERGHLFAYNHTNFVRLIVILLVAPAMALMVGLLRREADDLPALRESQEHLKRAQRIAHVGSAERDMKTGKVTWSDELYRIFGVNPASFTPTTEKFLAAIKEEDRGRIVALVQALRRTAHPPVEFRIRRPDGAVRWIYREHEMIFDAAGHPVRSVNSLMDVTDRRMTEQQLAQAQKMEAMGNLTGGLAHDFNNLLSIIIGNLDLVLGGISRDAADRPLLQDGLDAALRGADLTRRLLAYARRQALRPERTDINHLVTGITTLLRRTLGENIAIELHLAPDLTPIWIDAAQLEAAVANLSTHARDAMPQGGKLMIRTADVNLDATYAAHHTEVVPGDYILVEVCDTGAGMTAEVQQRIFEPFFTTKEVGKGSGLGLAMVFGFMKQSGGHISVYSEPGKGSCFRLYLPRTLAGETSPAAIVPATAAARGHERVLVVEDNAQLRGVVVKQLTGLGYVVSEAADAATALSILRHDAIDLLFTDIVMPGEMSGSVLAQEATTLIPGLKVLFTSGFPGARVDSAGWLSNGAPLLTKPYRKEELARALRQTLDGG